MWWLALLACVIDRDLYDERRAELTPRDNDGDGVLSDEDCDDTDTSVFPGAVERCDGLDNDCDGAADDDATDASPWYLDVDGDGYGSGDPIAVACFPEEGQAGWSDDCDDNDARVYPGAPESMDGRDENCNGQDDFTDPSAVIAVVPGRFVMGSEENSLGHDGDELLHTVTLTEPYEISATEVTWRLYADVMGLETGTRCLDCPVTEISWHEAARFTNTLSGELGYDRCYTCNPLPTLNCAPRAAAVGVRCPGLRLPTEAEWEFAARAGSDTALAWGSLSAEALDECSADVSLENGHLLREYAFYCGNTEVLRAAAGLQPNALGLYDAAGNAEEWVHDSWFTDFEDGETDPVHWTLDITSPLCTAKGGSYHSAPVDLRHATRDPVECAQRQESLGFRVARYLDP